MVERVSNSKLRFTASESVSADKNKLLQQQVENIKRQLYVLLPALANQDKMSR